MLELDEHLSGQRLRMVQCVENVADGAARDTAFVEDFHAFINRPLFDNGNEYLSQDVAVLHAFGIGYKAGIIGELGVSQPNNELAVKGVVASGDIDEPVFGFKRVVGADRRMSVSHSSRLHIRIQGDPSLITEK